MLIRHVVIAALIAGLTGVPVAVRASATAGAEVATGAAEEQKGAKGKSRAAKPKPSRTVKPAKTRSAKTKPVKAARSTASKRSGAAAKANRDARRAANPAPTRRDNQDVVRTSNENLVALLPPGMSLAQAEAGFRNHGEFVATLHAARNHDVSFVQLKHLMVNQGLTLGEALRALKRPPSR